MDVALDAAPKLSMLGKYSLIASLGQGGMAKVYLALMAGPAGFNKLLVVKALREDILQSSEEFVQMFLDEARLAARLNHPNIVQTYEVGESEGRYFIAMEYLEGQALRTVQRRLYPPGIPSEEELRIIAETARGLHYAHELRGFNGESLGVVHRDVSPQNVFVTYDGQVKLLDFGIAKTHDAEHMTKVGVIKGKIDYIAPEQIRGEKIDRRADIFALGAMLWEAVTGERFAGGPKVADVTKIHTRVTGGEAKVRELKPEISDHLASIVEKAIALNPADRYATALAFADDIDHYIDKLEKKPSSKTLAELMLAPFDGERVKMRKLVDQQIQMAQKRGGVALGETTGGLPRLGVTSRSMTPTANSGNIDLTDSGYLDLGSESQPNLEVSSPSAGFARHQPTAQVAAAPAAAAQRGASKLVVAAIVMGGVAAGLFMALRPEPETAVQAATPVQNAPDMPAMMPAQPQPTMVVQQQMPAQPAEPQTVRIHVDVWPSDAIVTLDGSQLPKIPFTAELRKDGLLHHIEASSPGHESRKVMLPFDSDRDVKIVLEQQRQRDNGPRRRNNNAQARQDTPSASPTPAPAPEPRNNQANDDDFAPGADLVPKRPNGRAGIDVNDPYAE